MTRKLVTVETISAIKPIPGADKIEAAQVRGWEVVVEKRYSGLTFLDSNLSSIIAA
jgi:hypothetical protein